MNVDTGEIKSEELLTKEDKKAGKWVHLTEEQARVLGELPESERPAALEKLKNEQLMKRINVRAAQRLRQVEAEYEMKNHLRILNKEKARKHRAAQKASRKRNRK